MRPGGVRFVSVTQQVDISGAVGRRIAASMPGLAEVERQYRRDQRAAGIAVAGGDGVSRGRKAGTTKALPRRARGLRAQSLSACEIARTRGISERTAWGCLDGGGTAMPEGPWLLSGGCGPDSGAGPMVVVMVALSTRRPGIP